MFVDDVGFLIGILFVIDEIVMYDVFDGEWF